MANNYATPCPRCKTSPRVRPGSKCSPCILLEQREYRAAKKAEPSFDITVDVPPDERPTPPLPWKVDAEGRYVAPLQDAPAPPLPPLENAYHVREQAQQKRDLAREHKALIEENLQLKAQLQEVARFSASPEIIIYDKAKEHRVDAIACALASDWHVEEVVEKAAVHGLNEYNPDIARERGKHFFKNLLKLTDIIARDSKVNKIWIGLLGDFFSGHIHEELMASTAMAPGDAAQLVKEIICSGIDFLLRESRYTIEADAIPGNHGRMTKQIWFSDPTGTSLETFMYGAIGDRYHNNPRVKINVAQHAMVYRNFFESFSMRLIHGYEVKYGGGVGGITIPVRKALAQWNIAKRASLTCFGHFHQRIDGGDFMGNGSNIGYNTYAQAIRASYEEPQQTFFVVHARKGGQKSVVAPIWLDDAHVTKTEVIP